MTATRKVSENGVRRYQPQPPALYFLREYTDFHKNANTSKKLRCVGGGGPRKECMSEFVDPQRTWVREDRHLRIVALRDRRSTTRAIATDWMGALEHRIFMSSVYRRIRSFGLRSYWPLLCLPLTSRHRAHRLQWCNERANWDHEWNRVVVSDESRFCLCSHPPTSGWQVPSSFHSGKLECKRIYRCSTGADCSSLP